MAETAKPPDRPDAPASLRDHHLPTIAEADLPHAVHHAPAVVREPLDDERIEPEPPTRQHVLREATELQERPASRNKPATPVQGPGSARQALMAQRERMERSRGWLRDIETFWARQMCITVGHDDCRDHFGTVPFPPLPCSGPCSPERTGPPTARDRPY